MSSINVDLVFEQVPSQWFSSQYCIHLLRKPVRTDVLLCDGKVEPKHAPTLLKMGCYFTGLNKTPWGVAVVSMVTSV